MKIRWGVALSVALMVAVGAGRAISQEGPAIVHFGPPKAAQLFNRPKPATELIYNQSTPAAADFQSLPLAEGISIWQSVGPAPIANEALLGANGYCPPLPISEASGRTTAMAFGAGGAIYLGTAGGGVWKSVDGGNSWNVLTDREPSLAVGALAVVPGATTAQDVVYVGTGEPNNSADSLYGLGLLKSVNGGQTWTQLGFSTFTVLAFARIAVIPGAGGNPDVLYAATTQGAVGGMAPTAPPNATAGLYKSVDAGNTWTLLSGTGGLPPGGNPTLGAATDVAVQPGNPQTVFTAITCTQDCTSGGVWRSLNGGVTWTQISSLPNQTARMTLYIPTATRAYALNGGVQTFDGVYTSTDGGDIWTKGGALPTNVGGNPNCLPLDQSTYNLALGGDPSDPNTVFVGLIGLYRSTDGGTTWSYTLDKAHPDFHAVVADNGVIYALNDGGLSISTNGTNWTQTANNGLATLQFTGASLGPQTDAAIYGGMQDNDLAIFSGSPNWLSGNTVADGGHTAFAPAGGVIFGSTQMANLLRSTTAQPDLNQVITPPLDMDIGETTLFYAPFELDPSNGDRLLYGTHRIWQSCRPDGTQCNATSGGPTDQAQVPQVNWSAGPALNPGCTFATEEGTMQGCLVTDVRVAPTNPAVMYAVTDASGTIGPFAWVSTNSNSASPAFTNVSAGLPHLGTGLNSVAISPIDPKTVVVAVAGFSSLPAGGGHIFKSTNQGAAWTDISTLATGFPNVPVTKVLFDANDSTGNTIIAGTLGGLARSIDGGQSWQDFSLNTLPFVQIYDLDQNPNFLLAATHGRSVWVLDTSVSGGALTVTAVNNSGHAGQSVAAGSLTVTNNSATAGELTAVTIGVDNPALFSSLTLSGGGTSAETSAISTATTFHFQPPVALGAGKSLTLNLTSVLSGGGAVAGSLRATDSPRGSRFVQTSGIAAHRIAAGLLVMAAVAMIAAIAWGCGGLVPLVVPVLLFVVLLTTTQSGCGGSSSSPEIVASPTATPSATPTPVVPGSSNQTVTQVWVIMAGESLQFTGLPGSLGKVTRN